jgi:hypothetical protein
MTDDETIKFLQMQVLGPWILDQRVPPTSSATLPYQHQHSTTTHSTVDVTLTRTLSIRTNSRGPRSNFQKFKSLVHNNYAFIEVIITALLTSSGRTFDAAQHISSSRVGMPRHSNVADLEA